MKERTIGKNFKSSVRKAKCSCHLLKRVNYVAGQVLTADDFRTEQNYHLGKHRRHNLMCHGFGVVQGLKVSVAKANSDWTVIVKPGFAIDPAGNEIQLCAEIRLPLLAPNNPCYVVLQYRECLTDPVPVPGEPCRTESETTEPSRILDDFVLVLTRIASPAGPCCDPQGDGCPPPELPLARLVRRGHHWYIDRKFKPARAH